MIRTHANRLREVRVAADLSQRRLAEKAGVSRITIVKIERGASRPTAATILALALALQCDPADLVNEPPQGAAEGDR